MRSFSSFSGGFLLAITLAGCGDGGTTTNPSSGSTGSAGGGGGDATTSSATTSTSASTGTGTGGAPSDVTGTMIDTYVTEAGDVTRVNTGATPVALVPSGNGFTTIKGTLTPDGKFTIPAVPAGTYYLGLQGAGSIDTFIVTDQRSFDLGSFYAGRPDVTPITTSPTPVVLDLTGMAAWDDTDSVEIVSQGAAAGSDLTFGSMSSINAGDTSITAYSVDAFSFLFSALI